MSNQIPLIHIFESQIHFKYLDSHNSVFPQGKLEGQFLGMEVIRTLYCLA